MNNFHNRAFKYSSWGEGGGGQEIKKRLGVFRLAEAKRPSFEAKFTVTVPVADGEVHNWELVKFVGLNLKDGFLVFVAIILQKEGGKYRRIFNN